MFFSGQPKDLAFFSRVQFQKETSVSHFCHYTTYCKGSDDCTVKNLLCYNKELEKTSSVFFRVMTGDFTGEATDFTWMQLLGTN